MGNSLNGENTFIAELEEMKVDISDLEWEVSLFRNISLSFFLARCDMKI